MTLEIFDAMPLAALVGGDYFCLHGGISPKLKTLKSIESIDRFTEPPEEGLLTDLLWADPAEDTRATEADFSENRLRGCSVQFGYQPLKKLLVKLGVKMLVRGHEVQQDGYKMHKWNAPEEPAPLMCTIFSAPNYCGVYQNKGAVLSVSRNKFTLKTFEETQPPFYMGLELANGNVFAHGLNLLSSTMLDIFTQILRKSLVAGKDNLEESKSAALE